MFSVCLTCEGTSWIKWRYPFLIFVTQTCTPVMWTPINTSESIWLPPAPLDIQQRDCHASESGEHMSQQRPECVFTAGGLTGWQHSFYCTAWSLSTTNMSFLLCIPAQSSSYPQGTPGCKGKKNLISQRWKCSEAAILSERCQKITLYMFGKHTMFQRCCLLSCSGWHQSRCMVAYCGIIPPWP